MFEFLLVQILVSILGALAAKIDMKKYLLPNNFTFPIFILALISQVIDFRCDVILVSVLVICSHLFVAICWPKSLGMGDLKFMAGLSLCIQTPSFILVWIYLAYFFGCIHGIWRKMAGKSSRIPFGVSIYGAWMLICVGEWTSVALDYSR